MYSNMKYYENICNCLRVIQQNINRKLKSANCWQRTSLSSLNCLHFFDIRQKLQLTNGISCEETKHSSGSLRDQVDGHKHRLRTRERSEAQCRGLAVSYNLLDILLLTIIY